MARKKEKKPQKVYVADFETTVWTKDKLKELGLTEQPETEVWSAAWCECKARPEPEDVTVVNNIYQFFDWMEKLPNNTLIGFVNLKFDSSYILNELINEGFTPVYKLIDLDAGETDDDREEEDVPEYGSEADMWRQPYSYKCVISNMGSIYSLSICFNGNVVKIVDICKVLPMSLREMASSMDTKYKKLNMEYSGDMHAFGEIDKDTQLPYIINDVLVASEAWFKARSLPIPLTDLTIGATSLKTYKAMIGGDDVFEYMFPDLTKYDFNGETGYEWLRMSYQGGLCWKKDEPEVTYVARKNCTPEMEAKYVSPEAKVQYVKNILCVDVNSLYPYSMNSKTLMDGENHGYPVGEPVFREGEPSQAEIDSMCVFRRFKCNFDIKPNRVPFVHIRNSKYYRPQEALSTDRVFGSRTLPDGTPTLREYTMTQIDFELFTYTYDIENYEPISYVCFAKEEGVFDDYVNMCIDGKKKATLEGNKPMRTLYKLLANNLYGKLATSTCNSTKIVYHDPEQPGVLKFKTHVSYNKKPVAIAAGSWCTSLARNYTVRCADKYYDHVKYIDTDSLHMVDIDPDELTELAIDPAELGYWDVEIKNGAIAHYVKQKTYIEIEPKVDKKSGKPYTDIILKAAGLSFKGKQIVTKAFELPEDYDGVAALYYNEDKEDFDMFLEEDELPDKYKDKEPDYEVDKKYIDWFGPSFYMSKINTKCKQIVGGILIYEDDFSIM